MDDGGSRFVPKPWRPEAKTALSGVPSDGWFSDEGCRVARGPVSGSEGYAEEAAVLLAQYESISFAELHAPILHLVPKTPCRVLDIGAGTGRDASAFAELGHQVVAVEPTAALRTAAMALHPSPRIEWIDDNLPDLSVLLTRGEIFDIVMLTAVWMHLDATQRRRAMPNVASLMRPGGVMIMALRHGPVPPGRRMFEVSAEETIELGQIRGLHPVMTMSTQSSPDRGAQADPFGRAGVSWTRLAFVKAP
jgi:SAM-dependent methyltransferase